MLPLSPSPRGGYPPSPDRLLLHAAPGSASSRRLSGVSRQSALRRPGRLHPRARPRADRSRAHGRGLLGPAVPGARRSRTADACAEPRPVPAREPVPGAVAVGVQDPHRRGRVRHHVRGRLPRAVHVQPARSQAAAEPPRRLRRRARQPVPRHRPRQDGGRRLADAGNAPSPGHRRPRPRPRVRQARLEAVHAAPLVRVHRHADACRPPTPAAHHRVRLLEARHPRPDARRLPIASMSSPSAPTLPCSGPGRTCVASRAAS